VTSLKHVFVPSLKEYDNSSLENSCELSRKGALGQENGVDLNGMDSSSPYGIYVPNWSS
jgi:hypothetical protein